MRKSNEVAIDMYKKLEYVIYRTVIDYYAGSEVDEDAYGECNIVGISHRIIAILTGWHTL